MTVHEAKLIQTFPDDYRICGTWGEAMRQIGNAVPVRLARLMGERMRQTLAEIFAAVSSTSQRHSPRSPDLHG